MVKVRPRSSTLPAVVVRAQRTIKRSRPALSVSVQYATKANHVPSQAMFRQWCRAALQRPVTVTLRIVDEPEGQALNRNFRGKDYATNVLTFAYGEKSGRLSGDIVICAPVVEREAVEQGKALLEHYAHLTVHGVLHLQGYDHENELEAQKMESLEVEIMRKLGFNDPYASEQS